MLHAARWKYRTQNDAKNRHLSTIAQLCRAISSQLGHVSTIGKNLFSSNISSRCPYNIVNFGPLTAEIDWRVYGAPHHISTGIASWQRYCTASSSGRQPIFAALNRGRHLCLAGQPLRWALTHILVLLNFYFLPAQHCASAVHQKPVLYQKQLNGSISFLVQMLSSACPT